MSKSFKYENGLPKHERFCVTYQVKSKVFPSADTYTKVITGNFEEWFASISMEHSDKTIIILYIYVI